MQHFLYAVSSDDPAPAGDGDAASWLRHYKLENDDMVYIPQTKGLEGIQAGDSLWFSVNNILQGVVTVDRVEEDAINDRREIWFNGAEIKQTEYILTHLKTAVVGEEITDRWLTYVKAP